MHNLAVLDAFAEIVNLIDYTTLLSVWFEFIVLINILPWCVVFWASLADLHIWGSLGDLRIWGSLGDLHIYCFPNFSTLVFPRLWRWWTTLDCKLPSSPDTLRVLLTKFTSMTLSMASGPSFRPIRPCPIVQVLIILAKFIEPSGYCSVINCTFTSGAPNLLGCFHSVMFLFELAKHKFPN